MFDRWRKCLGQKEGRFWVGASSVGKFVGVCSCVCFFLVLFFFFFELLFIGKKYRYPEFVRSSPEIVLGDGGLTDCVLRMLKGCVYLIGRGSLEELCEWVSADDGEAPMGHGGGHGHRRKFYGDMEDRGHALARAALAYLKNISMPMVATWKTDGEVSCGVMDANADQCLRCCVDSHICLVCVRGEPRRISLPPARVDS